MARFICSVAYDGTMNLRACAGNSTERLLRHSFESSLILFVNKTVANLLSSIECSEHLAGRREREKIVMKQCTNVIDVGVINLPVYVSGG